MLDTSLSTFECFSQTSGLMLRISSLKSSSQIPATKTLPKESQSLVQELWRVLWMNIDKMQRRLICECPAVVDWGRVSAGCLDPLWTGSPQACAQDTKACQMRKRRCNALRDHMNKSAHHPALVFWGTRL